MYLSVCEHLLKYMSYIVINSVHVNATDDRGSVYGCIAIVIFCRFMNDVLFADHGPHGGMSIPLQRVTCWE